VVNRRELIVAVGRAPRTRVEGAFERHVSRDWRELTGSSAGGRWGPPGAFSVLYLGRPRPSIVIEAYRHLVDPFEGMTGDMVQPRRFLVVEVSVSEVLDLRGESAAAAVGLSEADLASPVGDYEPCWRVARAAHQLGLHGILAPAATGFGETLAVFEEHLLPEELPRLIGEEVWEALPADPRRLRSVKDEDAS
jgi:RES domain-containing protein